MSWLCKAARDAPEKQSEILCPSCQQYIQRLQKKNAAIQQELFLSNPKGKAFRALLVVHRQHTEVSACTMRVNFRNRCSKIESLKTTAVLVEIIHRSCVIIILFMRQAFWRCGTNVIPKSNSVPPTPDFTFRHLYSTVRLKQTF